MGGGGREKKGQGVREEAVEQRAFWYGIPSSVELYEGKP